MKISIITTIYKAEKDLPRLLDSMMAQKSSELEFFLIDNGSPDKCGDICREYAKKDSRFTVFTIKENVGYIRARNIGMKECSGDYIGFCDSDDYLEVGGYDRAIEKIKESKCDLYLTAYKKILGLQQVTVFLPYICGLYEEHQVKEIVRPQAFGRFRGKNILQGFAWKQIFRKSIILDNQFEFIPELQPYEDRVFNIDVLGKTQSVYVDDNVIYNYIVNEQSITAKLLKDFDSFAEWNRVVRLYNEKMKRASEQSEVEASSNEAIEMLYECLLNLVKSKLTIPQVCNVLDKDWNRVVIMDIVKNSSTKVSWKCRFVKICLRFNMYMIMCVCVKCALNVRKSINGMCKENGSGNCSI